MEQVVCNNPSEIIITGDENISTVGTGKRIDRRQFEYPNTKDRNS